MGVKLTRYDFVMTSCGGGLDFECECDCDPCECDATRCTCSSEMEEKRYGDWVKWEDVEELLGELKDMKGKLSDILYDAGEGS